MGAEKMQAILEELAHVVGEQTTAAMTAPFAKPLGVNPSQVRPGFEPPADEDGDEEEDPEKKPEKMKVESEVMTAEPPPVEDPKGDAPLGKKPKSEKEGDPEHYKPETTKSAYPHNLKEGDEIQEKLSQKHYEKIAGVIRGIRGKEDRDMVVSGLADYFGSDNPKFKKSLFFHASGVEVPKPVAAPVAESKAEKLAREADELAGTSVLGKPEEHPGGSAELYGKEAQSGDTLNAKPSKTESGRKKLKEQDDAPASDPAAVPTGAPDDAEKGAEAHTYEIYLSSAEIEAATARAVEAVKDKVQNPKSYLVVKFDAGADQIPAVQEALQAVGFEVHGVETEN
jgi:hypothetical protein